MADQIVDGHGSTIAAIDVTSGRGRGVQPTLPSGNFF